MRKDMKLLYQFGVIMTVTFLGEVLHAVLPLPVPASIYGLLIMLFCLCAKVIKLNQVKLAADFLIDIMPPMFIPSAVGLITVWADLKEIVVPVMMIIVITTIFVMICTGKVSQGIIDYRREKEVERKDERVFWSDDQYRSLWSGLTCTEKIEMGVFESIAVSDRCSYCCTQCIGC